MEIEVDSNIIDKNLSSLVDEKHFFFKGESGHDLLGFLHMPKLKNPKTGIVFCHPFADEKNFSHSVIAKSARLIAANGFPVLRFDMTGCGDSQGEIQEITIDNWLQDIETAISILKQETNINRYILWGLRLGCGLTMLHAKSNNDVSALIHWQPKFNFKNYIHEFLFRKIASIDSTERKENSVLDLVKQLKTKGLLNIIGYSISEDMYNDFVNKKEEALSFIPGCQILVLSFSNVQRPSFQVKNYIKKMDASKIELVNVIAESFWDRPWQWECRAATDSTISWLNSINNVL